MSPQRRGLFGTDGVRGLAGEVVTSELATKLGRAATVAIGVDRPRVLVIRDTRESGPRLEGALASGVALAGGTALLGGVLPTPAASVLVRRLGLDLAAVVSASHNPHWDNGIKFISATGAKLGDAAEAAIEATLDDSTDAQPGSISTLNGGLDDYLDELAAAFDLDLSGMRIAIDCAHGATFSAAPTIFGRLGAEVDAIGIDPDRCKINDGFGSTHPEALSAHVRQTGAAIGFCFDGDGDRVIAVDGEGAIRDGDELIALAAAHLDESGELGGGVAVTVMTNHGFDGEMERRGIEVVRTAVGDRHVLEALQDRGWRFGGEQSGHVIWTDFAPTGDGIAAALLTLRALGERRLEDVVPFERLPQRLENVAVADRGAIAGANRLWAAVSEANAKLAGRGRVLVRASGTEPLLRVMVEAPDADECGRVLDRLVATARRELG